MDQAPRITRTVDGIVLASPTEQHAHSRWLVIRTDEGGLVRVVIACSAPETRWIDAGDRVRVTGRVVEKQWRDGIYPIS